MLSKLKENQHQKLSLIEEFAIKLQKEKTEKRQLRVDFDKIQIEKGFSEQEEKYCEKHFESENRLLSMKEELKESQFRDEVRVRASIKEREILLNDVREEKDQIQHNYGTLFEKYSHLMTELKELEKNQGLTRAQFQKEKNVLLMKSSRVEKELETKSTSLHYILISFYFRLVWPD